MNNRQTGLTWVTALVILILIVLAFGIVLPVWHRVAGCYESPRATVKTTIIQLSQALKAYETDMERYPPDHEPYGGSVEGSVYQYRNDVLVRYLDGDPSNDPDPSHPIRGQYFEFEEPYILNKAIYTDRFEEPFWYHNFQDDEPSLRDKAIDPKNPLHPWTNAILFRRFQIYSKAGWGGKPLKDAYDGKERTAGNFRWITNYHD